MRPDTHLAELCHRFEKIKAPAADSAVLTRVKLYNSRHLMGYVTYFLLTRNVSFFGSLVPGKFSVGIIFGALCQQTRLIVPVESAGAGRLRIAQTPW